MDLIEKTGSFYLGRHWKPETQKITNEPVMYDARDLTTHAVCVGMTGSGKTGMCIGLLEEAAMDGVPALIIDPKGDISNLLLTFPDLKPTDFEPWINPEEARRKGRDVPGHATATAKMWREGLADWGQDGDRIRKLREAAEFRIYTPGSRAGDPVSILASLSAPKGNWNEDHNEQLRDQIRGVTSALLGLAGCDADPMRSPEHIFFATVIEHYWRQGRDLDLADLIRALQDPPIQQLGVFEVDVFFPAKDRLGLAMALNGMLAAPGFSAWLEGAPLDIDHLLYTADGRPRHAIFNIAHLDDAQRMFFVTLLLESTLAWARRQSGTTSLRALLYMDEIYGFMPPTANPPSKRPLLTLLKQARAFGLGLLLTTQNPVDLDYKGLSNAGTWFIGKLQTEQDKARMMDGLVSAGGDHSSGDLQKIISGLDSRVFLMHNVHDDGPTIFHTRWVMSYLCGPLTRDQIRLLQPQASPTEIAATSSPAMSASAPSAAPGTNSITEGLKEQGYSLFAPPLKDTIQQNFLPLLKGAPTESATLVYEPHLIACGRVAFVDRGKKINSERQVNLQLNVDDAGISVDWNQADPLGLARSEVTAAGQSGALYGALPKEWQSATKYRKATTSFKDHLYRDHTLEIPAIAELKIYGEPGEEESAFLGRARHAVRELRDVEVDRLKRKISTKVARLEKKLDREEEELGEDKAEHKSRKSQELLSAGESILGMFGILGRKRSSGLSKAAGKRRMTARAKEDIRESEREIESLTEELSEVKDQLADDIALIDEKWETAIAESESVTINPRRADVKVDFVSLVWSPVWVVAGPGGGTETVEAWRRLS